MNKEEKNSTATQPQLMSTFVAGFNTVANNIYLIILPVLFDLFLWFGPHFRLKELLSSVITNSINSMSEMNIADFSPAIESAKEVWPLIVERFNLVGAISTFPIGIPSLLAGQGTLLNPIGTPRMIEINSSGNAFLLALVFIILGIILGALYFGLISQSSQGRKLQISLAKLGDQALQSLILTLFLILLAIVIAIPTLFIISLLALISPAVAQIALFAISFFILWTIIPLAFAPHGIFAFDFKFSKSILTSVKLVRYFLPSTGIFLLLCLVFTQGLNVLWQTPPETSWMLLIGIFGHAFISTGLIAASFDYYQKGMLWMQARIQTLSNNQMIENH